MLRTTLRTLLFLFLLVGCTLQPITEPRRPNPESEPTMVPTAIAIEKPTYVVASGSVSSQLVKSGRVTPVNQNQLGFTIDGRIATLLVSRDDTVSAGDVVAGLDTAVLEQSLQAAESELTLASEQLTIAEANKAADRRRAEIGIEMVQLRLDFAVQEAGDAPTAAQTLAIEVLKRELELAQLDLAEFDSAVDPALANQVAQAQLQVDNIQAQIAQSTLVAPIDGTITAVNFAAGDSVTTGETVLIIADLNRVEVQVPLLDRELQEVAEGMLAFGTIPSQPETSLPLTVRQLPYPYGTGAQEGDADSSVRLSFDNPTQAAALSIGDRIEVAILLDKRDNVLWLPPAAIREFNGRLFVVVQEGQTQKRIDIKIGLQNENQVEIISGVSEGQVVVGP
ncbi:MAG: efflux RND transporter periplasmic adaptor subunit [Ardenticatenaceae bacterium]|nr:efflux RND transporter periplasmic adaptor subunit [Ardenticatenaceae bacterium]MCB8975471.1 efflux RND transporter periplasmic adaptor subunit [Ardenticatenaceae bacterium]